MIYHAGLPNTYWDEAVAIVAYLKKPIKNISAQGTHDPIRAVVNHISVIWECLGVWLMPISQTKKGKS